MAWVRSRVFDGPSQIRLFALAVSKEWSQLSRAPWFGASNSVQRRLMAAWQPRATRAVAKLGHGESETDAQQFRVREEPFLSHRLHDAGARTPRPINMRCFSKMFSLKCRKNPNFLAVPAVSAIKTVA
jgi:hypothetical protein